MIILPPKQIIFREKAGAQGEQKRQFLEDFFLEHQDMLQKSQGVWELAKGYWGILNMADICPFIQEWRIRSLWLGQNQQKNILKDIYNINFSNLKHISLWNNSIESIECFQRICVPELQKLQLSKNSISEVKSLRKLNCPKFRLLKIQWNYIQDFSSMSELNALYFGGISLQVSKANELQGYSIRWVAKIDSEEFSCIQMNSLNSNRFPEPRVQNCLEKKYEDIEF